MGQDILMIANPREYVSHSSTTSTKWLSAEEFWHQEDLVKKHDQVLWQSFNTHSKYQRTVQQAMRFAVAVDDNTYYLGSAFVIEVGHKWLVEYVMTDPEQQGRGIGSAIMDRIMSEAKAAQVTWVILNCNPTKNSGQLPAFYTKFGFKKVA
ncbi:MAG: GNAT family N-acetyltransferase [Candidatus Andersenbacteria bacterium]